MEIVARHPGGGLFALFRNRKTQSDRYAEEQFGVHPGVVVQNRDTMGNMYFPSVLGQVYPGIQRKPQGMINGPMVEGSYLLDALDRIGIPYYQRVAVQNHPRELQRGTPAPRSSPSATDVERWRDKTYEGTPIQGYGPGTILINLGDTRTAPGDY